MEVKSKFASMQHEMKGFLLIWTTKNGQIFGEKYRRNYLLLACHDPVTNDLFQMKTKYIAFSTICQWRIVIRFLMH